MRFRQVAPSCLCTMLALKSAEQASGKALQLQTEARQSHRQPLAAEVLYCATWIRAGLQGEG